MIENGNYVYKSQKMANLIFLKKIEQQQNFQMKLQNQIKAFTNQTKKKTYKKKINT